MDFNDPATYLTDDEWFELAQRVDPAVQLIILKDTCHSGGSARFIGVRSKDGQERIVLANNPAELKGRRGSDPPPESSLSNTRFLVPPHAPARAWRGEVGSTHPTRLAEVPQTSLMACKETQTAADAPIDGDFHGAFTYHLCQVLRANGDLGSTAAIEAVAQQLQGWFEQVPQHEGREVAAPIFGEAGDFPIASDSPPTGEDSCAASGNSPLAGDAGASSQALTMLLIPAGSFLMGSPWEESGCFDDEGPQHEVTLAEFLLARTPITQAQWRVVAGWRPLEGEPPWQRELKEDPLGSDGDSGFRGDNRPVVNVSWHDAMEFCRRLRRRTGKSYTLPSEAQWEYACRAGRTTPFHFGATISPQLANYDATTSHAVGPTGEYRKHTTDVASFPANAWGLHDMHGNVLEWCLDHWHSNYAEGEEEAPTDGSAWMMKPAEENEPRLLRGGSWSGDPGLCRSACRYTFLPGGANYYIGFRVCCLPQDLLLDP
jgi:formylglycine-generating enzyme required for sulfatase activity